MQRVRKGRLLKVGRATVRGFCGLGMHRAFRLAAGFGSLAALSLSFTTATQDANANGETRSLTMVHSHTGEAMTVTYKRDGSFDSSALEKLNWFLRDWRVDEPITMAPQLFDVVWYVYREVGASDPIKIMSAYRSPGTNAMLRRRSRAVAKESQHMRGNAMDVHIPGVSMGKVREIGMRLQRGGVGYYPSAGSPFVHLDVGSVRSWPRMPREQLERLFPDGKTVHLPADGTPLANYQAALAEVEARGGSALDYETVTTGGKSLWARLFGGDEDEDAAQPVTRGRNTRVAAAPRGRGGSGPVEQVAAVSTGDRVNSWGVMSTAPMRAEPVAPSRPVRSETVVAPSIPEVAAQPAAPPVPAPAKVEPLLQIASLPVPPIRPRGAQMDRLVAASEPLPPIRPSSLTTLVASLPAEAPVPTPVPVISAPAPKPISGVPLPPSRPQTPVAVAAVAPAPAVPEPKAASEPKILPAPEPKLVNLPMPPMRPVLPATAAAAVAHTTLPGIVSRSEAPATNAGLTQAYAAVAAPLPPNRPAARPVTPVAAVAPAVVSPIVEPRPAPIKRPAATPPKATNPNALLAAQPEAQTRPARVTAVSEPPVEREVRSDVFASKFGFGASSDKSDSGFAGSFIRPLGNAFTKVGE